MPKHAITNDVTPELKREYAAQLQRNEPDIPARIREVRTSELPQLHTVLHWHEEIELIAVRSGQLQCNLNGAFCTLHAGEGLFINARQAHIIGQDGSSDCEFAALEIHPSLISPVPAFSEKFIETVTENSSLPYIRLSPDTVWQAEILKLAENICRQKTLPFFPLQLISAFAQIWMLLCEHAVQTDSASQADDRSITIANNMVGFIQSHYEDRITLADIARAGSVGQSKCCRLFALYYQTSPINFLNDYRLDRGAEQLRTTRKSVTEIAMETGFSDSSYFSKCFREWSGHSPGEYRRSFLH